MSSSAYPIIIPSDSDIEDTFSSTNAHVSLILPTYTPTSSNYSSSSDDNFYLIEALTSSQETTTFPSPPPPFPFSIPTCDELDHSLWIVPRPPLIQQECQHGHYSISDLINAFLHDTLNQEVANQPELLGYSKPIID